MRDLFLSNFLDVAILSFFHIASTPVSLAKYICIENSDKNRDPFAFNTGVSADSSSCLPLVAVWSTSGTRVKSHRAWQPQNVVKINELGDDPFTSMVLNCWVSDRCHGRTVLISLLFHLQLGPLHQGWTSKIYSWGHSKTASHIFCKCFWVRL